MSADAMLPELSAAEQLLETYHRRGSTLVQLYREMAQVEQGLSETLARHQHHMVRVRERLLAMGFTVEELDAEGGFFGDFGL